MQVYKLKNYNSYHWTTESYALFTHTGLLPITIFTIY